jgi:hypothetical protein
VLVCISAATDSSSKAINSIASGLARLDPPRPLCGFGGAAFVRTPTLQGRIHDAYFLGADALVATRHVRQLITEGPVQPRG